MKCRTRTTRLTALVLSLLMALFLTPAVSASSVASMGNFKKVRDYSGFSDVPASSWYANDVRQAYELGLMDGKDRGRFDPNGNLTLAEAVTMAVRVCAIYYGKEFVPGGTPWYQNAVDYAIEAGIIYEDEYTDFRAKATRADFANLLYWTIPSDEFPRINRIAWISDIDSLMPYFHIIYTLYGAGVLTGSDTGAFQPNEPVKRCEAAAIINRVALPENRVALSVTTNAPGKVITGTNANFKICVPQGTDWFVVTNETQTEEDEDGNVLASSVFQCGHGASVEEADALVEISNISKSDFPDLTLKYIAENVMMEIAEENGEIDEEGLQSVVFRGLLGYSVYCSGSDEGRDWHAMFTCVQNSTYYYLIAYSIYDDAPDELYDQMYDSVLFTLDIAL